MFFCYLLHGARISLFSQMPSWGLALFFMGLSRAAVAVSSVLNWSNLLTHVDNRYRGRVFSTIETMNWSTMMLSMLGAGLASQRFSIRAIGAVSGSAQLFDGNLLGLGKLDRETSRAGANRG